MRIVGKDVFSSLTTIEFIYEKLLKGSATIYMKKLYLI